jgi:hypothetical protein
MMSDNGMPGGVSLWQKIRYKEKRGLSSLYTHGGMIVDEIMAHNVFSCVVFCFAFWDRL